MEVAVYVIIGYFIGVLFAYVAHKVMNRLNDYDGIVHIDSKHGEKDKYEWEFHTSLYDIRYKKQIVFKVDPDAYIREDNPDYNETH